MTSFGNEIKEVSSLLSQCYRDGENSFNESTAFDAVGPKGVFSPEDRGSQIPLSGIIRRLNSIDSNKCPERRPQFKNFTTSVPDLPIRTRTTLFEKNSDALLERPHVLLEGPSREGAVANFVPPVKHRPDVFNEDVADDGRLIAKFEELLEVSLQMGPADLVEIFFPVFVDPPAIRIEDSSKGSHEVRKGLTPSADVDHKNRNQSGARSPQPSLALVLPPAGLIDIRNRLGLQVSPSLLNGIGEGFADVLLAGRNRSQGDLHVEVIFEEFFDLSFGEMKTTRKKSDGSHEPRTEILLRHRFRQSGLRPVAAAGTFQHVALIFCDVRLDLRNFEHLVPSRMGINPPHSAAADTTGFRLESNDFVDILDRNKFTGGFAMAGLRPSEPSGRRFRFARRCRGRISRWGH